MSKLPVTVTIITLNEEHNLPQALASVHWAQEIIVVDSGSRDQTQAIALKAGAQWVVRPWEGYGQQKNFAHSLATQRWVLNIDADERISEALFQEIQQVVTLAEPLHSGYEVPRRSYYAGQWIKHGGWYPNYLLRLSLKEGSRWTEPEVHEELQVNGSVGKLKEPLDHYTFDSVSSQVIANIKYAQAGANQLEKSGRSPSTSKMVFKPIWKFVECYFLKLGLLDGTKGFIIAVNAAHSMFLKQAFHTEKNWKKTP